MTTTQNIFTIGDKLVSLSVHIPLYDDRIQRGYNFIFSILDQHFVIKEIFHLKIGGCLLQDELTERYFYVSQKMFAENLIKFL